MTAESLHPKITASGGSPDPAMLTDGDLEKTTKLPIPAVGENAWIQYEFAAAADDPLDHHRHQECRRDCRSVSGIANPEKALEASDDGQTSA